MTVEKSADKYRYSYGTSKNSKIYSSRKIDQNELTRLIVKSEE